MAFNPKAAKDATRAQSLAVSFRDNTAHKSLTEIGKDPANQAAIKAFQSAAGLVADGKVGPKTLEAYNYYLGVPLSPATATRQQIAQQSTGVFKAAIADVIVPKPTTPPPITSTVPRPSTPTPPGKPAKPGPTTPPIVISPPIKKPTLTASIMGAPTGVKVTGAVILGLGLTQLLGGKKKGGAQHR